MARDDDFDVDLDDEKDEPATEPDDAGDEEREEKAKDGNRDRLRNAVRATRKERDEARRELAALRREVAELKRGGDSGKADSKDDAERDREADERAFARYRPMLVRSAAEAALVRAGAKPDRVGRLTRLLEVDDVNVDEKGSVDADDLAAEVDRVKEEWPELFKGDDDEDDKPKRRAPGGGGRRDGVARTGGSGSKVSSSTAKLVAGLTGGRR